MAAHGQSSMVQVDRAALELMVGKEKGRQYGLSSDRITIGRSEENDIVLSTEGISRFHALIERRPDGHWWIIDNQSKNGVQVNGSRVESHSLSAGDLIEIGAYQFRFLKAAQSSDLQGEPGHSESSAALYEFNTPLQPRRNLRPWIYGFVIALLLGFYFMSQDQEADSTKMNAKKSGPENKLARDFDVEKEPKMEFDEKPTEVVGKEDPVLTKAEKDISSIDWNNMSTKEAEQFFKKGQREYLSGNLSRAIDSFRTTLTIQRNHEQAEVYLKRSIRDTELRAKQHMNMAVSYYNSLQYQRAIYHFREVINLMMHRPTEAIVVEAEKYIAICRKRLQAAELFP